jgi:hypothetical protein
MRQETRKIATAFIERRKASARNTSTDGARLYLFNNIIAEWDVNDPNMLAITFYGYPTTTTKERLNGVFELLGLGRPFYTKDCQLYFGSQLRPLDAYEILRIDIELARSCRANIETIAA